MSKLTENFIKLYSALKPLLNAEFESDEVVILSAIMHLQSKNGFTTVGSLGKELEKIYPRATLFRKLSKLKYKNLISYHNGSNDEF